MNDTDFMRSAIDEAHKGMTALEGGPFGAVVVKGEKIIASSHNLVLKDNDPTHHAEVNAISAASKITGSYDLSGCVIYSTTEPCPMCFSAIHWARIDRLVYGTSIEDVAGLGFNELIIPATKMKDMGASPLKIESGFLLEECLELLRFWNTMPGRKVY